MNTRVLVEYLDKLLRIDDIDDDSLNGLQIAHSGEVNRLAAAVDASQASFQAARNANADLLLVHHGLFWAKPRRLVGTLLDRVRLLLDSNIALYAAHLPLDLHPEFGNNAQIGKMMGWPLTAEFGSYHGNVLGYEVRFDAPIALHDLVMDLEKKLGCNARVWDFGPVDVERLAFVSGGGLGMLEEAVEIGADAYITGEPKHESYWLAKEAGISVIFAGHYATETLGVKAVGEHVHQKFELPFEFIDIPTGL